MTMVTYAKHMVIYFISCTFLDKTAVGSTWLVYFVNKNSQIRRPTVTFMLAHPEPEAERLC